MGSVGDELLVARLRADKSRRWRRGASMASWAAPKWAQPRDRGTPRITKTGKGDAGNTPGRRRRRRRASSSTQSRRRPPRRRAGAASTRPRGAARPTARLRSRGSASMASGGVLSPRTECREDATPRRRGGGAHEQRAKGHRKRTGQRGDDVDEAQRPQRGQAPARGRASPCVVTTPDAAPYSIGNENGTAPRSAESAGRKHARTATTTTPSASFSGLAPPDAAPLAEVPFLGSVQLDTPVRSLT